jgi:3-oxoacyl-[acyl-carrier-protein] synthase II
MKPRAITGLGIASAFGTGADAFFSAMRMPPKRLSQRPPAPITSFDAARYEGRALPIVEVPSFDPTKYLGDKGLRTLDRLTKLLVVAARLCLHDAGLKKDGQWVSLSPERVGVCCSNAYGSLEAITELDRVAKLEDARYINPAKFPNTVSNSASGYVSIWEDLRALNVSVSDGNCGGLDAVACADMFLATERADAILTGGGESMSEALYLAFDKLGVLGEMRLGEGAAFFALEETGAAKKRGAKILGEVIGYGTAFVAPKEEITLLFSSREAMERAIAHALEDAKVEPSAIDVVASSMSGLAQFDDPEREAIASTLAPCAVSAPKLLLGETLGVSGTMSMAAALAWFDGAPISPLVAGDAPKKKVEHVLVTSVGYYGNASAIVMRRAT